MHVGDVPQDVLAAALGDHLAGQRGECQTRGITTERRRRMPARVMKLLAAGHTDANLERLQVRQGKTFSL